jgi:hypothetical protein
MATDPIHRLLPGEYVCRQRQWTSLRVRDAEWRGLARERALVVGELQSI